MRYLIPVVFSLLTACGTTSSRAIDTPLETQRGPALPRATDAMRLVPNGKKSDITCAALVAELARVTGVVFAADADARSRLATASTGLTNELTVPADSAWQVAEAILSEREFRFALLSREPMMLDVVDLSRQRSRSLTATPFVAIEDIALWRDHPAFVVQTSISLDTINIRDLSNSMRQMFTDPFSQQIIPMITHLTGFSPFSFAVK